MAKNILYVLSFTEEDSFLYGGHSFTVTDLTDIDLLKEKRPLAENIAIKILQYNPEEVREDQMIWFKINVDTNEIVDIETSFEQMQKLDFVNGYRYLGINLADKEDMGMIWKRL